MDKKNLLKRPSRSLHSRKVSSSIKVVLTGITFAKALKECHETFKKD